MQIMDSVFAWPIAIATFLSVVLIFILGTHIISVLIRAWKFEDDLGAGGAKIAKRSSTDRRRSRRIEVLRPVFVSGRSRDAQPFLEETVSLQVSAHGGLLVLANAVQVGQELFLATTRSQPPFQPCHVARLGPSTPLRTEVAIEFAPPAPEFWQAAT